MKQLLGLIFTLLSGTFPLNAQTQKPLADAIPKPREVTYCELSRDPATHNHELVRLTAFVTHGFEDFHLADPKCPTQGFSVWVMYGGKAQSGTAYCCPGESGERTRAEPLTVEGVQVPLVDDSPKVYAGEPAGVKSRLRSKPVDSDPARHPDFPNPAK